jgi:hypothetical protein
MPTPSSTCPASLRAALHTTARILSLRFTTDDLSFTRAHLYFGLFCTWLAGVGRYWDHPRPELLQTLGLGSLIYVFALSAFLWLLIWPLRPRSWPLKPDKWPLGPRSYLNILTLISLTAPPALLYAIPVERFLPMPLAQSVNAWFLGIVALWRVLIFFKYLRLTTGFSVGTLLVAGLLPLGVIIATLTLLNLEHVIYDLMAGLQGPFTGDEIRYQILLTLTYLSLILTPILFITYLIIALVRWQKRRRQNTSP